MTRRRLAFVVLLLGASHASAGELRGVVGIRPGPHEFASPLVDAVVMVEGPSVAAAPDAPHAVVRQRDHAFRPRVLAIAVGTTVDFPNDDPVLHDVNSGSPAKSFDLGLYDRGQTRSVTFDAPGVVALRCSVHPTMRATIVVHTNPWVAVTDTHGRYAIRDVPAGTYTIHVWHEAMTARRTTVSIPAEGVAPFDGQLERR
jgi:plastocyanin